MVNIVTWQKDKNMRFYKKLEKIINEENIDNDLEIPDFILAELICDYIHSIKKMQNRIKFHKGEK